jgi:hypothetical protein
VEFERGDVVEYQTDNDRYIELNGHIGVITGEAVAVSRNGPRGVFYPVQWITGYEAGRKRLDAPGVFPISWDERLLVKIGHIELDQTKDGEK